MIRRLQLGAAVAALVVADLATLGAQEPFRSLLPGERVRVTAPQLHLENDEALVVQSEDDSLRVRLHGAPGTVALPYSALSRLEVQRGRRSAAGLGALIGGSAGLALGLVESVIDSDRGGLFSGDLGVYAIATAALTGLGGLVGAGIGSAIHRDAWRTVTIPGASVGPGVHVSVGRRVSVRWVIGLSGP